MQLNEARIDIENLCAFLVRPVRTNDYAHVLVDLACIAYGKVRFVSLADLQLRVAIVGQKRGEQLAVAFTHGAVFHKSGLDVRQLHLSTIVAGRKRRRGLHGAHRAEAQQHHRQREQRNGKCGRTQNRFHGLVPPFSGFNILGKRPVGVRIAVGVIEHRRRFVHHDDVEVCSLFGLLLGLLPKQRIHY